MLRSATPDATAAEIDRFATQVRAADVAAAAHSSLLDPRPETKGVPLEEMQARLAP